VEEEIGGGGCCDGCDGCGSGGTGTRDFENGGGIEMGVEFLGGKGGGMSMLSRLNGLFDTCSSACRFCSAFAWRRLTVDVRSPRGPSDCMLMGLGLFSPLTLRGVTPDDFGRIVEGIPGVI
jgi:hypothetical protein